MDQTIVLLVSLMFEKKTLSLNDSFLQQQRDEYGSTLFSSQNQSLTESKETLRGKLEESKQLLKTNENG